MTDQSIRVVFRAEVSSNLGLGHMVRCLALAEALPLERLPIFVASENPDIARTTRLIVDRGWRIRTLNKGLNSDADAAMTAEIVSAENASLLVTDLCHRHFLETPSKLADYHNKLKRHGVPFLLSIEDCRMTRLCSDIAVIPYDCDEPAFREAIQPPCVLLEGLRYYICRPEFYPATIFPRAIRKDAARVLVCIGGGDPTGLTLKVAKALAVNNRPELKARIMLGQGMGSAIAEKVLNVSTTCPGIEVQQFSDSVVANLMWADLAVIGEGLIRFEAAMTGTPSLMISQIEHNSSVLRSFTSNGSTRYIRPGYSLTSGQIMKEIVQLLDDFTVRKSQSLIGKSMIDAEGARRVTERLMATL